MLRIVLADHHPDPLSALKELLQVQPGYALVGEAVESRTLLTQVQENTADLVIFDCELPGMNVEELVSRLHAIDPRPIVIIMSSGVDDDRCQIKSGADDYISKIESPDLLLDKLHQYSISEDQR